VLQGAAGEAAAGLAAARARCADVQQLKFGGPVDVSLLDTLGVSHKGAAELRQQLHQQVGGPPPGGSVVLDSLTRVWGVLGVY
jgi:hypothetical protein